MRISISKSRIFDSRWPNATRDCSFEQVSELVSKIVLVDLNKFFNSIQYRKFVAMSSSYELAPILDTN